MERTPAPEVLDDKQSELLPLKSVLLSKTQLRRRNKLSTKIVLIMAEIVSTLLKDSLDILHQSSLDCPLPVIFVSMTGLHGYDATPHYFLEVIQLCLSLLKFCTMVCHNLLQLDECVGSRCHGCLYIKKGECLFFKFFKREALDAQ